MSNNYTVEELQDMLYEARQEELLDLAPDYAEQDRLIEKYGAKEKTRDDINNIAPTKVWADTRGCTHPVPITYWDWFSLWVALLQYPAIAIALIYWVVIADI